MEKVLEQNQPLISKSTPEQFSLEPRPFAIIDRAMKFLFIPQIAGLLFPVLALATPPASSLSCDYYPQIEQELRCGPQSYFQKWGDPMCRTYLQYESNPIKSLFLTAELKQWFPQVRLCLQAYLSSQTDLNCANLDHHANRSHIECYVQTGYCELSNLSKVQLASISAKAVALDPLLWQQSALAITKICAAKFTSDSPFESDSGAVPFHE